MKRFVITEDERRRILSMHESATKRQYIGEQEVSRPDATDPKKTMYANANSKMISLFPPKDWLESKPSIKDRNSHKNFQKLYDIANKYNVLNDGDAPKLALNNGADFFNWLEKNHPGQPLDGVSEHLKQFLKFSSAIYSTLNELLKSDRQYDISDAGVVKAITTLGQNNSNNPFLGTTTSSTAGIGGLPWDATRFAVRDLLGIS